MKIRLLLLLVFLDALFCAAKKQSGRRGKKKMNLNSKLKEIKRKMNDFKKQMSAQHTSIFHTLDELKMQGECMPFTTKDALGPFFEVF